VQDTITPSADSAKIRILDLAPIGDTVNIAYVNVNGGTSVVSYSRSFNDQANNISYAHFISIPVGTYTFSVTQTGTTNSFPLEGTSQTQAFSADKVYTLALSGFLNTNFNSESLQLVNIENY
jgi:hypothetical protein